MLNISGIALRHSIRSSGSYSAQEPITYLPITIIDPPLFYLIGPYTRSASTGKFPERSTINFWLSETCTRFQKRTLSSLSPWSRGSIRGKESWTSSRLSYEILENCYFERDRLFPLPTVSFTRLNYRQRYIKTARMWSLGSEMPDTFRMLPLPEHYCIAQEN